MSFFAKKLLPCLGVIVLSGSFAVAQTSDVIIPAPPQLSAEAYILVDADTGKVIVEHNADQQLPPASLTKMMTSYVVSEEIQNNRLRETDLVRISEDAWKRGGTTSGSSTMFLDPRSEVPVIDLLRGVIVQSGNDASIALAQHLAGGEDAFAGVMNQHAQMLGMTSTHFVNSTGWPAEGHVSTARDLATLARALINDHPEHYKIYSEKYFTYNGINQPNRNRLLFRDDTVDGIKTGHTEAAGYGLVASSKRQDMRLISVVLGARSEESRAVESQKLLAFGFRYFQTHTLYSAGEKISEARVWKGLGDRVALSVPATIQVTIPRGSHTNIKAESRVDTVIEAPVEQGQVLGELVISLDGETLANANLVATNAIREAGLFSRLWDSVLLMFEGE